MNIFFILLNTLLILIITEKSDNVESGNNDKYLEFSFERNYTLPKLISAEELFKSLFYNQIYIKIRAGSQKIEIPFYLYLQQYSFIIQSSEVSNDQVKGLYNELKSSTYISSNKIDTFMVMDMSEGILSQDIFYLKNESLLDFYLCKKNNDDTHITEGGKIGFKLEPENAQSEEAFFITNLKHKNLISNLIFSILYDSGINNDNDIGKLYIGTYPHIINNNKFKEKYLAMDYAAQIYTKIEWALNFQDIKLGNKLIETNCKAFLYLEIGYIIGTKNFFDYFLALNEWTKFYSANKCHKTKFKIDDYEKHLVDSKLTDEYTIYYCNKNVDIKKINIGELSFIDKSLSFEFNFSFAELWEEKNDYKYFKIIQHEYYNEYWYFGKPFFKKFQIVFDYDNKKVGLYTKIFEDGQNDDDKNKKNNIIIYILIIIGLVIIIAGLIIVLIKNYKKFTKRKRANELLDDNYDYETKEPKTIN